MLPIPHPIFQPGSLTFIYYRPYTVLSESQTPLRDPTPKQTLFIRSILRTLLRSHIIVLHPCVR